MSLVSEARPETLTASPPSWRWVHIGIAALAMVATLPGRTHGLGVVTVPLLRDLQLDSLTFADINLWATFLGAAFCLPCGWLIDRLGTRTVLTGVLVALGGVVLGMSQVQGDWVVEVPFLGGSTLVLDLFLFVLLTRGFGQSALSVVSLALVGQAAGRRPGLAICAYSILVGLGFSAAGYVIKVVLEQGQADWRTLWAGMGWVLLVVALLSCFLVRPGVSGWSETPRHCAPTPSIGLTLGQALRTRAFWVFAVATSLYGMIAAGIALFNQSILESRDFPRDVFLNIFWFTPLFGLSANLATGWVATRWSLSRLLALAMFILTAALLSFPLVQTLTQVYCYAAAMSVAGGMVTVLFFAVWGQGFGPAHLGKIQGAAEMLTVLASACGPRLIEMTYKEYGSYLPLFQGFAIITGVLALLAWWTPLPNPVRFVPASQPAQPEPAVAN